MAQSTPRRVHPKRRFRVRQVLELAGSAHGRRSLKRSLIRTLRPLIVPMAALYRRTVIAKTNVVAVVGSFGKTTAAYAVRIAVGGDASRTTRINTEPSVGLHMLSQHSPVDWLVYECGIDRPGRMRAFARMVCPDVAVVTSIGSEHNHALGDLEDTRDEKAWMVRKLGADGIAVLNIDDANVMWMASQTAAAIVTFGFDPRADVRGLETTDITDTGTRLHFTVDGCEYHVETSMIGRASSRALLAAVAVARALGVPISRAIERLHGLEPIPGRLQRVHTTDGLTLICDDKKSPIETMEEALDTLASIPARRRIAVLGEPQTRAGSQGAVNRALGAKAASCCERILFVGTHNAVRPLSAGAKAAGMSADRICRVSGDVIEVVAAIRDIAQAEDLVLLKGRDSRLFQRIALALRGHDVRCQRQRCYLEMRCADCSLLTATCLDAPPRPGPDGDTK